MDDIELIRSFNRDRSQSAFETLAQRYVNLVYSAAVRQVRDRQLAEDVTQAVFLLLARKASKLEDRVSIAGWLLAATHYAAKDATRSERRRAFHETRAAVSRGADVSASDNAEWQALAPYVDSAMVSLKEPLRVALILRYFEKRSYSEVAEKLAITEPAARQRVSRAVQEVRDFLSRRGVVLSADVIAAAIVKHAVQAAPTGLGATSAGVAIKGTAIAARPLAIAKGAMLGMVPLGTKAAVVTLVVLAAGALGVGGYKLSTRSRGYTSSADDPSVALRDQAIHGVVFTPEGRALEGAEVMLAQVSAPAPVSGPVPGGVLAVRTGAGGTFQFPARGDARSIVVRADEGFAQVLVDDLRGNEKVKLIPWARIAGTVQFAGKPLAGKEVALSKLGGSLVIWERWRVMHEMTTRTDASGHFAFARVPITPSPSGDWLVQLADTRAGTRWTQPVGVTPGTTSIVEIGTRGRPIVGKLVADKSILSSSGTLVSVIEASTQPATQPVDHHGRPHSVVFAVGADGAFRIDGIVGGEYLLMFRSTIGQPTSPIREDVAFAQANVVVPDMPGGRSDEPLDVGQVKMQGVEMLHPGEKAPDFSAVSADAGGKVVRLSDFAGKFVLLTCRYPGEENGSVLPADLKAIYDRFGDRDQLAIVEIHVDGKLESAKQYRTSNNLPWAVAVAPSHVGSPGGEKFPIIYLSSATRMYLIGPDGRIVARSLSSKSVYPLLDANLKRASNTDGVRIEHLANDATDAPAWQVSPAGNNLARAARITLVDSAKGPYSGSEDVLHDGRLAENQDQVGSNLYFAWGSLEGRFQVDLTRKAAVQEIVTYSRHKSTRGPQVYKVFASDGSAVGFNATPKIGIDPRTCGWALLADVDSRAKDTAPGGSYIVHIAQPSRALGTYRYLLFEVFPTETDDDFGNTFYSEVEVLGSTR